MPQVINRLINRLPFELHVPGYQYCGPGTRLEKRLARGDSGVNPLDQACREHDIAYLQTDLASRHAADRILAKKALERFKSKDAKLGERLAALGIAGIMKGKVALGAGIKRRRKTNRRRRRRQKTTRRRRRATGGFLPFLLPLLGALGAAGSIAGGAAGIASAVNRAKSAQKNLEEMIRHNKAMEARKGTGLRLRRTRAPSRYVRR
jgi:Phospholipase A2-like domain